MDIAARKMELVDWLLHINDERKLKKILALKSVLDKEVVAHTISGYPVDKEEYINMVKEADERISSGKYAPIEDLEKEIDTLEELEKILQKYKLNKFGVPSDHKEELDKRLEAYRENPQDLLDWDAIKKEW
jgi:Putative addiction module component